MRRRRQDSVPTKFSPKSLSVRYAQVLRLREAVQETQVELSELRNKESLARQGRSAKGRVHIQ